MIDRKMVLAMAAAVIVTLPACGRPGRLAPVADPDHADVGYGTRAERDITGAVSSLSPGEVSVARPLAIEDLLRGKIPGLQVIRRANGQTAFRLRGTQSMLQEQEPLVVVDGVPLRSGSVATALSGLTPEDVERVDVLKDLASTAIYGSRGAGGVILIRTRR